MISVYDDEKKKIICLLLLLLLLLLILFGFSDFNLCVEDICITLEKKRSSSAKHTHIQRQMGFWLFFLAKLLYVCLFVCDSVCVCVFFYIFGFHIHSQSLVDSVRVCKFVIFFLVSSICVFISFHFLFEGNGRWVMCTMRQTNTHRDDAVRGLWPKFYSAKKKKIIIVNYLLCVCVWWRWCDQSSFNVCISLILVHFEFSSLINNNMWMNKIISTLDHQLPSIFFLHPIGFS